MKTGLTIAQAVDHSPAQLQLLAEAASRIDAARGLVDLHVTYAGVVATQIKEGRSVMEKTQKQLLKQSSYGGH